MPAGDSLSNKNEEIYGNNSHSEELNKLIEERSKIDNELNQQRMILEEFNVGMNEPLVDGDGFPRDDIPVYEIRHARAKIIALTADYRRLSEIIGQNMPLYFSKYSNPVDDVAGRKPTLRAKNFKRLAKLVDIKTKSPAFNACLKENDIIIEFGNVNGDNFKSLQDIAKEAKQSVDCYIRVIIERDGKLIPINLKPRVWDGNGLLGCNIVPLNMSN